MPSGLKERLKKAPGLFGAFKWSFYRLLRLAERLLGTRIHEWIWKSRAFGFTTNYDSNFEHPHRAHLVEQLMSLAPFDSLLEIGCNTGPNLALLAPRVPHAALRGIDINAEAVVRGRSILAERGLRNVSLDVGRVEDLASLPDKSVDVIFTDATLLYVGSDKIEKTFSEMKRVARKALLFNEWNLPPGRGNGHSSLWYYLHWIHDYPSLLSRLFPSDRIRVERVPPGLWGGGGWHEFGAIITVDAS